MKLTILERLMLSGSLPREGNIVTLGILEELKRDTAFSEEEIAEHEIKFLEDRVAWKPESNEYVKDIPMGPEAMALIRKTLEELNSQEKLTADFITLYNKFMADN